ncbi:ABC transporter permease [Hymenobacter psychrotolerans]|uniref:Peptide/nickel transport system permease protein n=1 Tax=Hymenobacter psychrotolerans DSM 18569 TaxID=1121959 RepID=A0A1M6RX67_9BACT|nr:ABC transporter permease [Hymenobacter psychrotolerans]SHK37145.1 peptide/nickel transport system permease protein [Hymenobacter psychrotolerans DSM 18569]
MVRRIFYQAGQALLIIWATITLLFLLTRSLANEQIILARFIGDESTASSSLGQRQQAQQQARHRLGLDLPLFYLARTAADSSEAWLAPRWYWTGTQNQYHQWVRGLGRGDAGLSYRNQEAVSSLLANALQHTLPLALLAGVLLITLSVPLGIWLAAPGRNVALVVLFALDTLPLFVVALLLLLLLANPDMAALFPAYGLGADETTSFWSAPASYISYLILPLASLVLTGIAEPAIQLATALRIELQKEYVLAARAKGLSAAQTLRRHALRNAWLPTITLLTDLLPNLLAGSLVVELIFALPGLGRLLAEAAAAHDHPVLLGGAVLIVLVRQLSLWLAEGLYRLADPRLRTHSL